MCVDLCTSSLCIFKRFEFALFHMGCYLICIIIQGSTRDLVNEIFRLHVDDDGDDAAEFAGSGSDTAEDTNRNAQSSGGFVDALEDDRKSDDGRCNTAQKLISPIASHVSDFAATMRPSVFAEIIDIAQCHRGMHSRSHFAESVFAIVYFNYVSSSLYSRCRLDIFFTMFRHFTKSRKHSTAAFD
jgi:hypothetical protein